MKRVIITGPLEALGEYADAARVAGWTSIELPLLEIVERDVDAAELLASEPPFDWLLVASSSALPFVARALAARPDLTRARFACVGVRTAERARSLELACALEPADDRAHLAQALLQRESGPKRALWPRGDRSDDLARVLRAADWAVVDPIVYEARTAAPRELPAAEALFLASPSAARTLLESGASPLPHAAIAIGRTTFDALASDPRGSFESIAVLSEPTPGAFELFLRHQLDARVP